MLENLNFRFSSKSWENACFNNGLDLKNPTVANEDDEFVPAAEPQDHEEKRILLVDFQRLDQPLAMQPDLESNPSLNFIVAKS